jgi:hypothetical protein
MNYKEILLEKINNLINGTWSVPEFEKEYYQYYLDEIPDKALNLVEDSFFGLVQEKLDWTSENPNEQEKKEGWFNHLEYIAWLKGNTQSFLKNENTWYKEYISSFK